MLNWWDALQLVLLLACALVRAGAWLRDHAPLPVDPRRTCPDCQAAARCRSHLAPWERQLPDPTGTATRPRPPAG